jgi:hypothetical protein
MTVGRWEGRSQGTFAPLHVLETQQADGLVTTNSTLDLRAIPPGFVIEFAFGFATDETTVPGAFLDAFTISFVNAADPFQVAVLLTVDPAGLVIAPLTPGGIALDPTAISLMPVLFPPELPGLSRRWAYQLTTPIPHALQGQLVTVYFDLFDNANQLNSLAWASQVFAIPEPGAALLMTCGLALWFARKRRNRSPTP